MRLALVISLSFSIHKNRLKALPVNTFIGLIQKLG
jgi:hypothetical protein